MTSQCLLADCHTAVSICCQKGFQLKILVKETSHQRKILSYCQYILCRLIFHSCTIGHSSKASCKVLQLHEALCMVKL